MRKKHTINLFTLITKSVTSLTLPLVKTLDTRCNSCKKQDSYKILTQQYLHYTLLNMSAHSPFTLYNPSNHGTCLSVSESNNAWYFDSDVSKHKTSCQNFFISLEDGSEGDTITCAKMLLIPMEVLVKFKPQWQMRI